MTDYRSIIFNMTYETPIIVELVSGDSYETVYFDWVASTRNVPSGMFFEVLDQSVGAPEGQTVITFVPWANIARIYQVRPVSG
jgi:hypothetical protein